MINNFVLIGKIGEITDKGIMIKVTRAFKNADGIYEEDLIFVECLESIMQKVKYYCKVGCTVGIKGRTQVENENLKLICEKLTFLSNNKELLKEKGVE